MSCVQVSPLNHNLRVWPSYRPQDPTICIRWILGHQQSAWLYFFRPIPFPFISLNYQILFFFVPYFSSPSSFFLSLFVSTLPSFLLEFVENDFFFNSRSVEKERERKTAAGEGWVSLWKWYRTCSQEDRPQTMVITRNETPGSTDGRERRRRAIDDVYTYTSWTWKPG